MPFFIKHNKTTFHTSPRPSKNGSSDSEPGEVLRPHRNSSVFFVILPLFCAVFRFFASLFLLCASSNRCRRRLRSWAASSKVSGWFGRLCSRTPPYGGVVCAATKIDLQDFGYGQMRGRGASMGSIWGVDHESGLKRILSNLFPRGNESKTNKILP